MKKRILIIGRFASESLAYLKQFREYEVVRATDDQPLRDSDLASASALIVRSTVAVDETLLQRAAGVQVVVSATSGFDHIDFSATERWGITVMHTPDANVASVAQFTLNLILQSQTKMATGVRSLKAGDWRTGVVLGSELNGRTLGVVGLGRIGKTVAHFGRVLGLVIIAYDPYVDEKDFRAVGATRVSYEELLKCADIVSFHVPKTSETLNMLNRSHFEYIHRGSAVINTSRGGVINEDDLVEALRQGWVSFAGLDVFAKEPLSRDSALMQLSQVVLTPHMASLTEDAFFKTSQMAAEKVVTFLREGLATDTLPPKADWYGVEPRW